MPQEETQLALLDRMDFVAMGALASKLSGEKPKVVSIRMDGDKYGVFVGGTSEVPEGFIVEGDFPITRSTMRRMLGKAFGAIPVWDAEYRLVRGREGPANIYSICFKPNPRIRV